MPQSGVLQLYVAKGVRVFYSSLLSILIPQYLLVSGYSVSFLGFALVAILGGNVVSNLLLTYSEARVGKKRLLQFFSVLMVASGLGLSTSASPAVIILGCFLGNISTTGTEAGPFQSVEAGVLPGLSPGNAVEAFGKYNMIGYGASAVGALAAGTPGFLKVGPAVYNGLFLGFAVAGALLFVLYSTLRGEIFHQARKYPGLEAMRAQARRDLTTLSILFSVDAFGGSFVSQYVLSSWFLLTYNVSSAGLGEIFFVASIIVVFSVYGAAKVARSLGNLRTMVYTHLLSNVFLVAIPLAGSLAGALVFLFLRQSLSQMDVPTRQALMSEMFGEDERVTAFALSNTARSVSSFAGGPVNTVLLALGLLSGILYVGGFSKMAYDLAVYYLYRGRFR